ncbi:MAG: 50S ribosomal protein L13 [Candidatus Pacearchaeota archaeon]
MKKEIIVDGKRSVLGKLAAYAVKESLIGKKVIVLNSAEVIISGNKKDIKEKYLGFVKMGGSSQKGPKIIRSPDRFLKRIMRGMLPHKQERGREALKRIICYNNCPNEYKDSEKISVAVESKRKAITLNELIKELN